MNWMHHCFRVAIMAGTVGLESNTKVMNACVPCTSTSYIRLVEVIKYGTECIKKTSEENKTKHSSMHIFCSFSSIAYLYFHTENADDAFFISQRSDNPRFLLG